MTVTGLEHVLVLSDDIDTTRDFYVEIVGLRLGDRPPLVFDGYWLYAGAGGASCLHIADRAAYRAHAAGLGLGVDAGAAADPGAAAVDHIAFDADDHAEIERRIERRGLRAVVNEVPDGPRQLFITDPNGVLVEINVKRQGTA